MVTLSEHIQYQQRENLGIDTEFQWTINPHIARDRSVSQMMKSALSELIALGAAKVAQYAPRVASYCSKAAMVRVAKDCAEALNKGDTTGTVECAAAIAEAKPAADSPWAAALSCAANTARAFEGIKSRLSQQQNSISDQGFGKNNTKAASRDNKTTKPSEAKEKKKRTTPIHKEVQIKNSQDKKEQRNKSPSVNRDQKDPRPPIQGKK
jgi:hypothetical protein